MNVDKFVFEIFLRLTSKTCPYGHENDFIKDMSKIFPQELQIDKHGNYFYKIGTSRTIFASHIDTVSKEYTSVTHVINDKYIKTDGKTTLGADDKAGVTVMLWMIKNNIPGTYYFFIGEEVGCIGSGLAAKYDKFKGDYDRIISFDRRDTDSIITFQSSGRCCSDIFADALSDEFNKLGFNYKKDNGGIYTDSAEFIELIPECTNISVGYYKEHTLQEYQNIEHLIKLADACTKINWELLPIKRDMSIREFKTYESYNFDEDSWYSTGQYFNNRGKQNRSWRDRDNSYAYFNENAYRKTRRTDRKKKNSKTYYDSAGNLVEIVNSKFINSTTFDDESKVVENKYSWILYKFLDDKFSSYELEIIKELYLNMEEDVDVYFYNYLKDKVVD